jgi:hypothetical protein
VYGGIYLIVGLAAAALFMTFCLFVISPTFFAIYSVLCGIHFPITIAYTDTDNITNNINFAPLRLYVYAALALSDAIWHPIKNLGTLLLGLGITQIFYFFVVAIYHSLDITIFGEEHDRDPISDTFYHAFGLGVIEVIGNWCNKMKELFEDKLIIKPHNYDETRKEQQEWDEYNRTIAELNKK